MAGRIREDDIALVRERSPIGSIVEQYVQLRNAGGGSLKGLCPFHDEKTPSFQVSPARGYFHCFGCGEGGDVISFVMKIDHLTFTEAVERLAGKAGVQLRYEEGGSGPPRQQGQRSRLVEANKLAAEFFASQLQSPEAVTGRQFLAERGFDSTAAELFGVGYAPKGWDALTTYLRAKGFRDEELLAGGLVSQRDRGVYDRFRGRLIWPIRDITGDPIGFGARKLYDDDQGPKYLNTPETPIYKKSQVLYGIHQAKKEIAKRGQAVVVEGYTDVMACHLSGVETAVATCGTSFGEDHIKVLRRLLMDDQQFRGEVVFTFDGDAAGQKAALRAFQDDQRFVTQTYVAVESSGMDPCELRQQKGEEAVRELVSRRVPLFEFAIRSSLAGFDLNIPEGRVSGLRMAAPLVAQIRDRSLRMEYARLLSGWLGMEAGPVLSAVAAAERSASRPTTPAGSNGRPQAGDDGPAMPPPTAASDVPRPDPANRSLAVEREALKVAVQSPVLAGVAFDAVDPEAFAHPAYAAVRRAIATAGGSGTASGGETWVTAVRSNATSDVVRALVTELAVEPLLCDGEPDTRYADEQIARVLERQVERQVAELRSRLQRTDPSQTEEYNRVFGDLVALEQRRRQLRDRVV